MHYKILVTSSRVNNNVGGAAVVQTVLEYSELGQAEKAARALDKTAAEDKIHQTTVTRLYL